VTPPRLTVVKVGGSLFDWPELPLRLGTFLDCRYNPAEDQRIALVAGGGAAADLVRTFDQIHALGDNFAHRLALRALDFTAYLLAALLPQTLPIDHVEQLPVVWDQKRVPILLPRPILDQVDAGRGWGRDPLPATWDITSDSIAARIAHRLGAECLVLLKSSPVPDGTTRRQAARLALVDPKFPHVASKLARVEYLNLRDPTAQPRPLPP
jgi:aspartokinase-like uncharacterized kinase